jgi:FtsZ-interacting cell division protein ZipA
MDGKIGNSQFLVIISFIKLILLKGVWTKRATASDVFHKNNEMRHCQWRVSSALVARCHSYI